MASKKSAGHSEHTKSADNAGGASRRHAASHQDHDDGRGQRLHPAPAQRRRAHPGEQRRHDRVGRHRPRTPAHDAQADREAHRAARREGLDRRRVAGPPQGAARLRLHRELHRGLGPRVRPPRQRTSRRKVRRQPVHRRHDRAGRPVQVAAHDPGVARCAEGRRGALPRGDRSQLYQTR